VSKIIVDTVESSGTTVTVNDGLTSTGNINAGTNSITAGSITGVSTIASTVTFPGKLEELKDLPGTGGIAPTALVWRDTGTADDSAVADVSTSQPYSWWRKLDNESDPFGIITLSGDIITVTNAGKYAITFSTGCHFRTGYTSSQIYNVSTSTVLATSPGGFVNTSSTDYAGGVIPTGFWVGTLAAATQLKFYSLAYNGDNEYFWSAAGSRIFSSVQIQLLGT